MDIPTEFFKKWGVDPARYSSPLAAKREFVRVGLERDANKGSVSAEVSLQRLPEMREAELDMFISEWHRYDEIARPNRNKRKVSKPEIFAAVSLQIGFTKNESEAARRAYAKSALLQQKFGSAKVLGNRYTQIKKELSDLQGRWEPDRFERLGQYIARYRNDEIALAIAFQFFIWDRIHYEAGQRGDTATLLKAERAVEALIDQEHPIVAGLVFLFANKPVSWVWQQLGVLMEKLHDDGQRAELFSGTAHEGTTAREAVKRIWSEWECLGLMPGKV